MKKLNLGSGTDIREGYVNLDISPLEGVQVVHDLQNLPFPFDDNYFDEILCLNIIEHIPLIETMKELHRILKKGGKLIIQVPHYTSKNNFIDPTHINRFSISTFDFFIKDHYRSYYFDFSFGQIVKKRISFERHHKFMELINFSSNMQIVYESCFLSSLFQGLDVMITLEK